MNLSKGTILLAVIVAMPAVTSCQHDTEILWKQMRKQIPLYNPESILIPAGKSSAQVSGAIRRSLLAKKWLLVKNENGRIEASYKKSNYILSTVDIQYDNQAIRINYKESEGLNYDSGTGTIHKSYNETVRGLETVIRGQIRD